MARVAGLATRGEGNQTALCSFLDFATGKTTEVLSGGERQELGLDVSPDGKRILFSKVDQFDSDLMLIENFRRTATPLRRQTPYGTGTR